MFTNTNRFLNVAKRTDILLRRSIAMESKGCKNILVEPFYGGSHKQLMDLLVKEVDSCQLFTLPAKKWHWKARTSALHFSQVIPVSPDHRTIFASSVLNLAELVALRSDIARLNKVVYVHENQLCYPVRVEKDRDFQYGYNQILTCLVADVVVFNSHFNMESFLSAINSFLKKIRDHRPKNLEQQIRPKCRVLYFPLEFPDLRELADDGSISRHEDVIATKAITSESTVDIAAQVSDCSINTKATSDNASRLAAQVTDCSIDSKATSDSAIDLTMQVSACSINSKATSDSAIDLTAQVSDGSIDSKATSDSAVVQVSECSINSTAQSRISNLASVHRETSSSDTAIRSKENDQGRPGTGSQPPNRVLHLVWAHRWEHDKDPETLFKVLYDLHDNGCQFKLSVLGERFTEIPEIFVEAKDKLKDHILHWGYLDNKLQYYQVLHLADVSISTALHEFYGVAMLESVYFGCFPLCPNRLVYPEIFPEQCLYNTPNQLYKKLKNMCSKPESVKDKLPQMCLDKYLWRNLKSDFINLLS